MRSSLTISLLMLGMGLKAQSDMVAHVTRLTGGFETAIVASNLSDEPTSFRCLPYDEQGHSLPAAKVDLAGQETKTLSAVALLGDGVSHFTLDSVGDGVRIQIRYRFAETPESMAHVETNDEASTHWLIAPGDWSLVFDGFAAVNRGTEVADVTVRQVGPSGELIQEVVAGSMPINGKILYVIGGPDHNTFDGLEGSVFEVRSTQPLALTALRGTPPSVRPGFLWGNVAMAVSDLRIENAGLSLTQRTADFEQLVHFVNKRYGPLFWKKQALGVDLLAEQESVKGRIVDAYNDPDFFEEMMAYIALFQDAHTSLSVPSSYVASLPFGVDLYSDRLLVDRIDKNTLGLRIGDELMSMDGEAANELIDRLKRYTPSGFDRAARRWATTLVTWRSQAIYPQLVSGTAHMEIKRIDGSLGDLDVDWEVTGTPFQAGAYFDRHIDKKEPNIFARLDRITLSEDRLSYFTNFGKYAHVKPSFDLGPDFFVRMGDQDHDEWYVGFYGLEDKSIGFVRIPQMSASSNNSLRQLTQAILELENDTDGLVIDVTDNPGGLVSFCNHVASFLHREPFPQVLFQMRPDLATIQYLERQRGESGMADEYTEYLITAFRTAYENGTLTEPISLEPGSTGRTLQPARDNGVSVGYSKPIIVLINDLSVSGGDYLPATLQDSGRAKLVGYRTMGGGGHVNSYSGLISYSEMSLSLTGSLMVRDRTIQAEGYPDSPYIENVGVHPDIPYDYQNEEDLMDEGRSFVTFFNQIILDEIRAAEAKRNH